MDDFQKYKHDHFFAVWCKYEDIANHFNGLIIQIRIKSLALITSISSILAIYTTKDGVIQWELLQYALMFQFFFLLSVCVLDLFYYNRLLTNTVIILRDLEKDRPKTDGIPEPNFSTVLDDEVGGTWIVQSFYLVSLSVFSLAIIYCGLNVQIT